ncbi:MAG: hypothetical protein ACR2MQ_11360 [Gemmatimonadaceae bacterium]
MYGNMGRAKHYIHQPSIPFSIPRPAAVILVSVLAPALAAFSLAGTSPTSPTSAFQQHSATAAQSDSSHSSGKKKTKSKSTKSGKSSPTADADHVTPHHTPPAPAFTVTPLPNSILPGKRVVVYYGNPLSKRMGVLGEYPQAEMLAKLQQEVKAFAAADPSKPVQPGLHLIVSVAQGAPGRGNTYRLRMRDSLIDYWCKLAESKGYLMFLDVQVGHSTVQSELQPLIPYLKRPYVHLALDPEFSMHHAVEGIVPGKKIGVMDAEEINYAIRTLADLVKQNHLSPKILVVHRFTQKMLTNYRDIRPVPEVQVVINMDGFGPPWLKRDSYEAYERMQPVQFTGFKLFYKNDHPMLTPAQIVKLDPAPVFITFQ